MSRRFLIVAILLSMLSIDGSAQTGQDSQKVVTSKWSLMMGPGRYVNHYLTDHEYTGQVVGIKIEHGAFYRRSEHMSWNLDVAFMSSPYFNVMAGDFLTNPAGSAFIGMQNINLTYGTHYNWSISDRLDLRLGANFDFYSGINNSHPNGINNAQNFDIQTQLQASTGLRYGWYFNKFGIALYGTLDVPLLGGMLVNSRYQGTSTDKNLLRGTIKHYVFSSLHNMQGYEYDLGVNFIFNGLTLSLSYESFTRMWHAYELQNVREFPFVKFGVSMDLESISRIVSRNRYF